MFLTSEWFVDDFGDSSISHLEKPVGPLGDYRVMSNHHDCRVFLSGNFVHHTDHLRSVCGSRSPVGSSARMIWGRMARALAFANPCCFPPPGSSSKGPAP